MADDDLLGDMVDGFLEKGDLPVAMRDASRDLGEKGAAAAVDTSRATAGAAGDLTATYSDIERLATTLGAHSAFVAGRVTTVGGVLTDGDFVESAVLSPGTAATVTGVVVGATAALALSIAAADALAVVTVAVVSTYELADSALQVSAAGLGGAVSVTVSLLGGTVSVAASAVTTGEQLKGVLGLTGYLLASALESGVVAVGTEGLKALVGGVGDTWQQYVDDPGQLLTGLPGLQSALGDNVAKNYDDVAAWGNFIQGMQSSLGALGPGYDVVVKGLLATGDTLGMFEDGEAVLGGSQNSQQVLDQREMKAAADAYEALYGDDADLSFEEFYAQNYAADGKAAPHDLAGLLLGAQQVDAMGAKDEGVVRIIATEGEDGVVRYTVQIPSTQQWNPYAGTANPNDLTSDMHAIANGDQTALAQATYDAMARAGISKSDPVMLVGFSLGGITAGAMAAGDSGYNIQQVVTAGSPIANFDIPSTTRVTSLESGQDPIAILDGASNPTTANRTLVSGDAPSLHTDDGSVNPSNAHDALRYASMASASPANADPDISRFLGGTSEDFFVTRRP
ncbi:hypothetical protein [Frigoribacterium sp. Leaf186]|uniref:hypothetical protein n=1 Tax=Frigoribacterium sp. Leaf186 TaxID=1736293 RepID=UPI0006FEFE93|nr:hypothetical protein [Frigoribacterium sp. Leaf186]KQS17153.1 hypothetical protein ASG05_06370 [Frigoribacterium sp. Leaf186]